MQRFKLFSSNSDENSTNDVNNEATNLAEDEDFIKISENLEISIAASMEKYGDKTLAVLKAELDKISNVNTREERAYRILEELEGVNHIPIPDVKYPVLVCNLIFDEIAKEYTKDKVFVENIRIIAGMCVFPNKAEVLPAIFSNFPNILNDQQLKEEDLPRPPSPWSFS